MRPTKPNVDDFVEGAKASAAEKIKPDTKVEFEFNSDKTFPLRIPAQLHAAAAEKAKKKGRALHRYILELIAEDVGKYQ